MADRGERANHALWAGPLIALFGALSYFTLFYRWPALRDFPWLNLLLLAIGLLVTAVGLRRAWPRGGWRATAGAAGTILAVAASAGFVWYNFSLSYDLPDAELALGVGETVPAATLLDQTGRPTPIAASANERVILVFYRGYW